MGLLFFLPTFVLKYNIMKLELDFRNKVIKVEDTVNFKELIKTIKETLKDWKDWNIQGQPSFYWNYYPPTITYTDTFDWSSIPTITCGDNITTCLYNNTDGTITLETT